MIKKHSILLLSTFFILNTSTLMYGSAKPGPRIMHKGFTPTPVAATTGTAAEESINNSPKSPIAKPSINLKTEKETQNTNAPIPQSTIQAEAIPLAAKLTPDNTSLIITAAQPRSSSAATPAIPITVTATAVIAVSKEPTKITMRALINRQKSIFNIMPTSVNKKLQGVDVVVLGALTGLRESEEVLDCEESDTQSHLAQTVQAIIDTKNIQEAEDLLNLAKIKKIFFDKTSRRNLRKFLKSHRDDQMTTLRKNYIQQCQALEEAYEERQKQVQKTSTLVDDTYKLGGSLNLIDEELAFLQGQQDKLTKEQQDALAIKTQERNKEGLSDNEEEHPDYQETTNLVKISADKLFSLKPSTKSYKKSAAPSAKK